MTQQHFIRIFPGFWQVMMAVLYSRMIAVRYFDHHPGVAAIEASGSTERPAARQAIVLRGGKWVLIILEPDLPSTFSCRWLIELNSLITDYRLALTRRETCRIS